jgi:queuine/archaeosine tRNA-ribosyltransferase
MFCSNASCAAIISIHNLTFYRALMVRMREAIVAGTFRELYEREAEILASSDVDNPSVPPVRRRKLRVTALKQ